MTEPAESAAKSSAPSIKDYLSFYEVFRDYVKHEDTLINNRFTWILTIHGFLYATYGFTLQKELEVINSLSRQQERDLLLVCHTFSQIGLFLFCIAVVGILISFFGWRSMQAAREATLSIDSIFRQNIIHSSEIKNEIHLTTFSDRGVSYALPAILGGGKKNTPKGGFLASNVIPWALLASWVLSLLILLLSYIKNNHIYCTLVPLADEVDPTVVGWSLIVCIFVALVIKFAEATAMRG